MQSLFWEQVKAVGDVPAPRSGHTFTKVGTRYLLFGGMGCQSTLPILYDILRAFSSYIGLSFQFPVADGKAQAFNDIYEFEPGDDESKWTLIPATNSPPARARHAAFALDDDNLLVFGGVNKRDRYEDLCIYNCPSKSWSTATAQGCSYVNESGVESIISPGPRAHFTAAKASSRIYVFGGYGGAGIVYGDLWALHVDGHAEAGFTFRCGACSFTAFSCTISSCQLQCLDFAEAWFPHVHVLRLSLALSPCPLPSKCRLRCKFGCIA